jgi:hypothetical protein
MQVERVLVMTRNSTLEPEIPLTPEWAEIQEPWEGFAEDMQIRLFFIRQFLVLIFSVMLTYYTAKLVGAAPNLPNCSCKFVGVH